MLKYWLATACWWALTLPAMKSGSYSSTHTTARATTLLPRPMFRSFALFSLYFSLSLRDKYASELVFTHSAGIIDYSRKYFS